MITIKIERKFDSTSEFTMSQFEFGAAQTSKGITHIKDIPAEVATYIEMIMQVRLAGGTTPKIQIIWDL